MASPRRPPFLLLCVPIVVVALTGCTRSAEEYVERGNALFEEGQYAEAELNYRKALQKQPDLGEAHYRLALSCLEDGRDREAYDALRQGVASSPDFAPAKVELARMMLDAYRSDPSRPEAIYAELQRLATDLIASDARVKGLNIKGKLALIDQRPEEAIDAFRQAAAADPTDPDVVHGLVQALWMAGRADEAEEGALELIEQDQAYGQIYDALYAIYQSSGRGDQAKQVFERKIANNPGVAAYRLQLAAHFINQDDESAMEAALEPLRKDPTTFPQGRLEIGELYMRLGRWDAAIDEFRAAEAIDSARLGSRKRLIQALVGAGKADEALRAAEEGAQEFPDDSEIRLVRASLWLDQQDAQQVAKAIEELKAIQEEQQRNPRYWIVLAEAYQRGGDFDQAKAAYNRALQAQPNSETALLGLAELSLKAGQARAAVDYAAKAIEVNSDNPRAALAHATALLASGRPSEARQELTRLTNRYPDVAQARLQLGRALLAEGDASQAQAVFRQLYRPGQADLGPLDGLARSLVAAGRADRAIELLTTELNQNPNPHEVRRLLATIAIRAGRSDVAISQLQSLVQAQPDVARHHYLLAESLRAAGRSTEAIESLEEAERLEPEDAASISLLAFLLQREGRDQDAIARLRRVVELRPNDANTQNNLAFALAEEGQDLEDALRFAQAAVRQAPDNAHVADTLGWVYLKKGQVNSAIPIFEKLVQRQPQNTGFRYHLGLAQLEKGDPEAARRSLLTALKSGSSETERRQIQAALARIGGGR